jgi:hypothetical protein
VSGVLSDAKAIAETVKRVSPETLVLNFAQDMHSSKTHSN